MTPVRFFSPTIYWIMMIAGLAIFAALMLVAWTSDSDAVELAFSFKLKLMAAATVLGGGLVGFAVRYKRNAEAEAREAELVQRQLGRR